MTTSTCAAAVNETMDLLRCANEATNGAFLPAVILVVYVIVTMLAASRTAVPEASMAGSIVAAILSIILYMAGWTSIVPFVASVLVVVLSAIAASRTP